MAWQDNEPDVAFSEQERKAIATFIALLNTQITHAKVASEFYDDMGDPDDRFSLEMSLAPRQSVVYMTDSGTDQFEPPPPGEQVYARGWFEVFASLPVHATSWVQMEHYSVERCRSFAYPLPLQDVSLSGTEIMRHHGLHEGVEPLGVVHGKLFESGQPWQEVAQEAGARRGEPPHDPEPPN
jgi:hypothetical protein